MTKLCLNMIVKNESKIIERLLDSVLSIIDSVCICDTGSSDNTIEIIENFMKKHTLPGIVFSEPFQNFGYNRTVALEKASVYGDYLLLLDADMKLVVSKEFNKEKLTDEAYEIVQQNNEMRYYNTRIIKTGVGIKCVGPTHEYYHIPKEAKLVKLHPFHPAAGSYFLSNLGLAIMQSCICQNFLFLVKVPHRISFANALGDCAFPLLEKPREGQDSEWQH